VMFTKEGTLEVDTETLKNALTTNFNEVKALFSTAGTATHSTVRYVSATDATQPGTYAVNITQVATVASATGAAWTTTYDGSGPDQMTVHDAYTGKSAVISLVNGDNVDTVIEKLNNEFAAQGATLTASKTAGSELVITGSKYGSAASFTVSYQQAGVDTATAPTGLAAGTYAGLDVAGTIGGEAATGSGQILTAASGTTADGLSIQYTGSATGAAGDVTYVRGVAGELERIIATHTRAGDGLIALHTETLDESIAGLQQRELSIMSRLELYEESLVRRFTAMEEALGQVQAQGNWLGAQIQSLQSLSWGEQS
jgi:flagellar hook-associated protein 2